MFKTTHLYSFRHLAKLIAEQGSERTFICHDK